MRRFFVLFLAFCLLFSLTLPAFAADSEGDRGISETDRWLLVRLVAAEAGDEPLLCQVCLAALVLNRRDSDRFPNTVSGVIRQKGAFSAVTEGRLFSVTDPEKLESARVAVAAAAYGMDPAGGSLYYAFGSGSFVPLLRAGGMVFGQ